MDFKLKMNCDNHAFWVPEIEIRRILRDVAERVDNGLEKGKILDHNGNKVGKWEITDV